MRLESNPRNPSPDTDWLALAKELLMPTPTCDATVESHGSICLVTPLTKECRTWLRDNVQDDATWYGCSLVVEPRFLDNLVTGMTFDGLVVR